MRNLRLATVGAAALVAGAGLVLPTFAAAADAAKVDEVVVTVRKRSEKLFDVPNAVTAVSAQKMEDLRLNDARDLVTLVPTAFLQENNAGTARDINIRGIGTPNLFAEPGVAMYVDEVYASGFISYPTQFYDLERVEVLRGPQGALYGRNAVGGAVNVISHRATSTFGAYLTGAYARYDRTEIEGMANLPLGETAAIRVTGWKIEQDKGEYFNTVTKDYIDAFDSKGGRIVASFNPTAQFSLDLIGETTESDGAGTNIFFPQVGENKTNIARDTQPTNHYETTRFAGVARWRAQAGEFTLIAGSRTYDLKGLEDTDLSADFAISARAPLGKEVLVRNNTVDSKYLEARWLSRDFGPVNYLVGFNYLDEQATGDIDTDLVFIGLAYGSPAHLVINNDQSVKSAAGFAEVNWKLTDHLTLTGDLRYTNDKKDVDFVFAPTPLLGGFGLFPQATKTSKTFKNWSPGVTLAYAPDDDTRAYAKIQTGFRAGGYNFNVGKVANLPYDEENSVNYEIGVKRKLMDGRAVVGATGYLLTQRNVLVSQFDLTVPGPLGGYLDNVGKARTWGLELEATARPVQGLDVTGSLGFLNAEFTDGTTFGGSVKGNELPTSRKFTAAFTANYRRPITDQVDLLLNGAYTHRAKGFGDVSNSAAGRLDAADLLNLSGGVDIRRHVQVLGYVQNATDDDYVIALGGFLNGAFGQVRAPGRTYGLKIKASF